MLRPRLIPCLLIQNGGLVKTVRFGNPKYVGDPINAVRIYNEKQVDELMVIDIDATVQSREPDYNLIKSLASECRMPLCFGGGVKNIEQIEKIIKLGVEKVAISSEAINNLNIIKNAANRVGNQSIVFVMDVKKTGILKKYELFSHNGRSQTGLNPAEFVKRVEEMNAGEIVINSIDCDGVMNGYDTKLVNLIRKNTSLPITVLGGAGSLDDISNLFQNYGIIGASAGSLFVFKGIYKAVLINYPSPEEKEALFSNFDNKKR